MSTIKGELFVIVREQTSARPEQSLTVADLAEVGGDQAVVEQVGGIEVIAAAKLHRSVSALTIVRAIRAVAPGVSLSLLGATKTIIEPVVVVPTVVTWLRTLFAGALLFVGSGLAIMNFHADVDMPEVQAAIYQVIVGHTPARPWIMQIPYSIGVGLGILVFFRGLGGMREPGPLQLESDAYQRKILEHYQRREEASE